MAKTRAKARAERERLAAAAAAKRERENARRARRRVWARRLTGWIPASWRGHNRQSGALAAKRRKQRWATFLVLLVINVVVWFVDPTWSARAFVLVASVLIAPVLYTVLFRRER